MFTTTYKYRLAIALILAATSMFTATECLAEFVPLKEPTPTAPTPTNWIPQNVPDVSMPSGRVPGYNPGLITLSASFDVSLANSPRMSGARESLGIAKSAFAQALVLPNPGIYISNVPLNNNMLGITVPIEPPWKIVFRVLVAKEQLKQARLELSRTMWLFRGEVRRAYTELVMAQERVNARKVLKDLSAKLLDVTKTHFDTGNAPGLDVRRARLPLIQAKIDYEQAEIQVQQAKEQLSLLMGQPVNSEISVPRLEEVAPGLTKPELLPDFSKNELPLEHYIELAKHNRLELNILRQTLKVNSANMRNSVGNIMPTPRFVFGRARELNWPSGPVQDTFLFQAYIDVPLFDFQQGNIARFAAVGKQIKRDLVAQDNIVESQASLAYRRLIAARARIRTLKDEAIVESEAVVRIANHGYQLGQTNINTLLDAQQANIQIRNQYLDAVLAYHQALNDLEQAVGVPLE